MTDRDPLQIDVRAASWLRAGPDAAPSDLLDRSLARTRSIGQRPGLLAIALGAPDATSRGRGLAPGARWALVAAGLLAATIVAILAAGSVKPDLQTSLATGTVPPGTPAMVSPRPDATQIVYDTGLGLSVASDVLEPWTEVDSTWFGVQVLGARDFHYPACPENACTVGEISLSVARLETGFVIGFKPRVPAPCPPEKGREWCAIRNAINSLEGGSQSAPPEPVRLAGQSMDELLAAAGDRLGQPGLRDVNGVKWAVIDGPHGMVAFTVAGPSVVSVTAHLIGSGDDAAAVLHRRFERFLSAIVFDDPPAPWPTPDTRPVTTRWLELELTLPGWPVNESGEHLYIPIEVGYPLGATAFDVNRIALGSTFTIKLGDDDASLTSQIGGATFDDFVASIKDATGAGKAAESRVDGRRLLRWFVPQPSLVGPLVWIAVLDAGDHVYLFQEHYAIETLPQPGDVETLLDGLHFVEGGSG